MGAQLRPSPNAQPAAAGDPWNHLVCGAPGSFPGLCQCRGTSMRVASLRAQERRTRPPACRRCGPLALPALTLHQPWAVSQFPAVLDSRCRTDYTRFRLWRFLHSCAGRGQWCLQAPDGGGTLAGCMSDQQHGNPWWLRRAHRRPLPAIIDCIHPTRPTVRRATSAASPPASRCAMGTQISARPPGRRAPGSHDGVRVHAPFWHRRRLVSDEGQVRSQSWTTD